MSEPDKKKVKPIAFYLPQFHPIPENDKWWGKGFTEWTNVKKAKPLFPGHHQPVEPGELGYYDLRNPEIRQKQAELAKKYGIKGFCYWHYWFGHGKTLLEKPFQEVLKSGEPDFPFCLGWANDSWTGSWGGDPDRTLIEQTYPGIDDIKLHFEYLLPAFEDSRYIKVENKPFFLIYKPQSHPNLKQFTNLFNEFAIKHGFDGIHFVATNVSLKWEFKKYGFDAVVPPYHHRIVWEQKNILEYGLDYFQNLMGPKGNQLKTVYEYKKALKYFVPDINKENIYPMIVPNWDDSPRHGERAVIFTGASPSLFEKHVREVLKYVNQRSETQKIVMIKSWNEWAEGNYLEPDKRWGRAFLEVFKKVLAETDDR